MPHGRDQLAPSWQRSALKPGRGAGRVGLPVPRVGRAGSRRLPPVPAAAAEAVSGAAGVAVPSRRAGECWAPARPFVGR